MLRSVGGTSFTTSSPISTSPELACSRPAVMRRTVVLPEPDGPTSTRNSPSAISRSRPSTPTVPSLNTLRSRRNSIPATSASVPRPRLDQVAVPERAPLGDTPLRRVVDVDDSEALVVALLPLEVVEQRPDVVAAEVDALLAGAVDRGDVRAQVPETGLVRDDVAVEPVVERGAVLGDHHRDVAVVAL